MLPRSTVCQTSLLLHTPLAIAQSFHPPYPLLRNPCIPESSTVAARSPLQQVAATLSPAPHQSFIQKKKEETRAAMAVHDESKASEKKPGDEIPIFNAENLQNNMKSIYYSRTFLSIIGGVIAGIWGFTGLTGFVFYFLIMALTSLGLAFKAKLSVHEYFDSWNRVIFDGFFGGLMSFVLFWTFAYDIVHIF